jgi:hypothetical protein
MDMCKEQTFSMDTRKQQTFSMDTGRLYKEPGREEWLIVREFKYSVVSAFYNNQWTTTAEEVTDS